MTGGGAWYGGGEGEILSPTLEGYASASTDGGHGVTAAVADWALTKDGDVNWPNVQDVSSVAMAEAAVLWERALKVILRIGTQILILAWLLYWWSSGTCYGSTAS